MISYMLASVFHLSMLQDSIRFLLLGVIIETVRRFSQWITERISLGPSITARFDQDDPAYDWIFLFLTERGLWRRSNDFEVFSKSARRLWDIMPENSGLSASYVPRWAAPRIFTWNGYWIEAQQTAEESRDWYGGRRRTTTICLTLLLTSNVNVLAELVEEAKKKYEQSRNAKVTVHTSRNSDGYGSSSTLWNNVMTLPKRPLTSVALEDGVLKSLVEDVREFLCPDTEDWYRSVGIPYHRGILLWGSPGTGKTSTIHVIAGELGLEIYSLTLSASNMDDGRLQSLVSDIPPRSILLLEDIDCAVPSRDAHTPVRSAFFDGGHPKKSQVTLSGLLNVLDGVGTEGGLVVFATTNYPDRLDPALSRPGRIDKKIEYKLASRSQARALFCKFFPDVSSPQSAEEKPASLQAPTPSTSQPVLADLFAQAFPANQFTTSQIQGYLLGHRGKPSAAIAGLPAWLVEEEAERRKEEEIRRNARHDAAYPARLDLPTYQAAAPLSPHSPNAPFKNPTL